jgi:DNA-binding NtrC family response regulator
LTGLFTTRNRAAGELARVLARLAASDLAILLEGETGCGKSFLARAVHRRSRPRRPLVVVDCGTIPGGLLASELFGHSPGAFTDATRARTGWLTRAADGTLVLDRVDTLPPESQIMLLRVLEERSFRAVGGTTPLRFRARVVALANAGLQERIEAGAFRADLYHRLAGYHARLPALRQRPEDILPAARRALRRSSRRARAPGLSEDAERLLVAYPWPGNFRELEVALTRARLQAQGPWIAASDLGLHAVAWEEVLHLASERRLTVNEVMRLYAAWVVAEEGGNLSRAARRLGLSRRTLMRWRGAR